MQRYRQRVQNHQVYLNVMPSAALSYAKQAQNHQVYLNVMLSAALSYAKVHFYLLT